jgi:hypothetical protein
MLRVDYALGLITTFQEFKAIYELLKETIADSTDTTNPLCEVLIKDSTSSEDSEYDDPTISGRSGAVILDDAAPNKNVAAQKSNPKVAFFMKYFMKPSTPSATQPRAAAVKQSRAV